MVTRSISGDVTEDYAISVPRLYILQEFIVRAVMMLLVNHS